MHILILKTSAMCTGTYLCPINHKNSGSEIKFDVVTQTGCILILSVLYLIFLWIFAWMSMQPAHVIMLNLNSKRQYNLTGPTNCFLFDYFVNCILLFVFLSGSYQNS